MAPKENIHVLGIESSCDDTGVAIVRQDGKILSNCIHSQLKSHLSQGGIIPALAKEFHLDNIDSVARRAFQQSGLSSVTKDIDAIAVSNRPGMSHSLQVGLNYARQLAKKYSKPLIPIHHMQAHSLMPLLQHRTIKFPFMTLLISGGHCLLAICERQNKVSLLGASIDDAPGDVLDKVARRCRVKNLGFPFDSISGGAALELLSQRPGVDRFKYFNSDQSVPMLQKRNCDFSFSGYKGSFELVIPTIDKLWEGGNREELLNELGHISGSLQRVILLQLFKKLQRAMYYYRSKWRYTNEQAFAKHLSTEATGDRHLGFGIRGIDNGDHDYLDVVVSGGVAANSYIIDGLSAACKIDLDPSVRVFAPSKSLCSDNGLMVAWNGMLRYMDHQLLDASHHPVACDDLNYSVISDPNQMDLVKSYSDQLIGVDIRGDVRLADFKLTKLKNSELKLRQTS